ncbi:MAG: 30S ribosomal protein S19 [Nitrosarchaeum sp.]|nr:30S ribosomal protein S19 [Nitrosarchaeum sp.]
MAKKEFTFKGLTMDDLRKLSLDEFVQLIPARERRSVARGLSDEEKKLREKVKAKDGVKTHLREMIILPEMVGKTIKVHNGKEFLPVLVQEEMLGHRLGEFALTRKALKHSAPGVGATKSSSAISVR